MRFTARLKTIIVTSMEVIAVALPLTAEAQVTRLEVFDRTICRVYEGATPQRPFLGQFFLLQEGRKYSEKIMTAGDVKVGRPERSLVRTGLAERIYVEQGLKLQPIFDSGNLKGISVARAGDDAPSFTLLLSGPGCERLRPAANGGVVLPFEWEATFEDQIFAMLFDAGILKTAK